jgi:hypothetical protein
MKPFATISLHDLLVLGHRLGLDWTEVDPNNDKLVAQDDFGNDLSAHRVRGLGLVVQYSHDSGRSQLDRAQDKSRLTTAFRIENLMVPSSAADKLAFGIIPGDTRLHFDDTLVATREDCLNFAASLTERIDAKRNPKESLERSFQANDFTKSGLDQLMPLISPVLVLPGCRTNTARRPNGRSHVGVLEVMEGFVVFEHRLQDMQKDADVSSLKKKRIKWILDKWVHLEKELHKPFRWAAFRDQTDKARLSTEIANAHEECTSTLEPWSHEFLEDIDGYLLGRHSRNKRVIDRRPMNTLLRFHLLRAFELRERAQKLDRAKVETYGLTFPDAPMFCGSRFSFTVPSERG